MLILLPESALAKNKIKCNLTVTGDDCRFLKSVAINPKNINRITFDDQNNQTVINYLTKLGPTEYVRFIYTGGDCVLDLARIFNQYE